MVLRSTLLGVFFVVVGLSHVATAQTFTWTGAPIGDWSQPSSWTPIGPPNSATADVFINGGPTPAFVTLDSDRLIRNLTIGGNDRLTFDDGVFLRVAGSTITNNNLVIHDGATSNTTLFVEGAAVTITGDGQWQLSDSSFSRIRSLVEGNTLINDVDHTITGSGNIGQMSQLGIVNRGTISVGDPGDLVIEPGFAANASGVFDLVNESTGAIIADVVSDGDLTIRNALVRNMGLIRAGGSGGDVLLENVEVNNTDGVIRGADLGTAAEVFGGEAQGVWSVRSSVVDAVVGNLLMPERLILQTSSSLLLEGTLTFDTGEDLQAVSFLGAPSLRVSSSGVTLSGDGIVQLGDGARIIRGDPVLSSTLIIEQGMRVEAENGVIGEGNGGLGIINRGTIAATNIINIDSDRKLIINPGLLADVSGVFDFVNELSGRILAESGQTVNVDFQNAEIRNEGEIGGVGGSFGTIRFTNCVIDNTGGIMGTGIIVDDNTTIRGGRGRGVWTMIGDPQKTTRAVIADIIMPTGLSIASDALPTFEGTLTFDGESSLSLRGSADPSVALIDEDGVTLAGSGGRVLMSQESTILAEANGASLTIGEGNAVHGDSARLGNNDDLGIINHGTIAATQVELNVGPFVIEPGLDANASGANDFVSTGTIRAEQDIDLVVRNAWFQSLGVVEAMPNSAVIFEPSVLVQNININGELTLGRWRAHGPIAQPARIEMNDNPIQSIGSETEVELSGPVARFVNSGIDIDDFLTTVDGTLRLLDGNNFLPANSIANNGLIEIGLAADILGLSQEVNFNQSASGTLLIQLGGTADEDHGQIDLAGMTNLDGRLEVSLSDGYMPSAGDLFEVIIADSGRTGVFAELDLPDLDGGLAWDILYNPRDVVLTVFQDCSEIPSDCDCDGDVDLSDFANFVVCTNPLKGGPDPDCECFDADNDGDIDLLDFGVFQSNFTD